MQTAKVTSIEFMESAPEHETLPSKKETESVAPNIEIPVEVPSPNQISSSPNRIHLVIEHKQSVSDHKEKSDNESNDTNLTLKTTALMVTIGALTTLANSRKLIDDALGEEFVYRYINDIPKIVPLAQNYAFKEAFDGCLNVGEHISIVGSFAGNLLGGSKIAAVVGGVFGGLGGCILGGIKGLGQSYFSVQEYKLTNPYWAEFDTKWLKRVGFDFQSEWIPSSVMPKNMHGFIAEMAYQVADKVVKNPEIYLRPISGSNVIEVIAGLAMIILGVKKGLKTKEGFGWALTGTVSLLGICGTVIKFDKIFVHSQIIG
jgi:hypothetical protein